jgi:hypothetical protein
MSKTKRLDNTPPPRVDSTPPNSGVAKKIKPKKKKKKKRKKKKEKEDKLNKTEF